MALLLILLGVFGNSDSSLEKAAHASSFFPKFINVRANLNKSITLKPLERALIKTGLFIELPVGYEAQVRPRSGLAYKKGITVLNSPGTIDADYRGEIGVILVNLSKEDFVDLWSQVRNSIGPINRKIPVEISYYLSLYKKSSSFVPTQSKSFDRIETFNG